MLKKTGWYIAFLTVLLAGDRVGGYFLQQQVARSQFRYSRMYNGAAGADILLLGNSRGLTFYQPYIEEKTDLKTFNMSYNGLPMDVAKVLVQDYLERYRAPKRLLIDITSCDRRNDELMAGFLSYSGQSFRLDTLIHNKLEKVWWGGKVSALFRYNNEIFQRALSHRKQTDAGWLLDRVISPKLAAEVAQHQYPLEIHPYLLLQLKEICADAQARGVDVHLVISPYFPQFAQNVANLNALKKAAEEATGLTVTDYSRALPNPTDFGDFMHPNIQGSKNFIDLMRKDGVLP